MTALDTALRSLRASALRTERQAQRTILAAWKRTLANLAPYITAAIAQAAATQASQPTASFALLTLPTVQALRAAFGRELPTFATIVATAVAQGQQAALSAAPGLAQRVILGALGTPPPGSAVPILRASGLFVPNEGAAQVAATIARLAPGMGDAGARAVAEGVARGAGPREIARDVRKVANLAPVRALTISRHSINSGFRESTLATYRANGDVVTGYRWLCAKSVRTCPPCWSLDGREFRLDQPFATHICCRCTLIAITRDLPGWQSPPLPEPGRVAFGALSPAEQRQILGVGKYQLWLDGLLDWDTLVQETFSVVYGPGRRETPLRELRTA